MHIYDLSHLDHEIDALDIQVECLVIHRLGRACKVDFAIDFPRIANKDIDLSELLDHLRNERLCLRNNADIGLDSDSTALGASNLVDLLHSCVSGALGA